MFQFQFHVDVGFCMLSFLLNIYIYFFFLAHSVFVVVFYYCADINFIFTLQSLRLQQKTNFAVFSFREQQFHVSHLLFKAYQI